MLALIPIWIFLSKSVPIPDISSDGFTLTISGAGEITPEISKQSGDSSKIMYVIIDKANSLSSSAFFGFVQMVSIQLPSQMSYIGSQCFYQCTNLKRISIPEGITDIFFKTFFDCQSLEEIQIPMSLKTIDLTGTFYRNRKQTKFIVDRTHPFFSTDNSGYYLMSQNQTVLYRVPANTAVIIPKLVKLILTHTSYNAQIVSISFEPDSAITEIQSNAFDQENIPLFSPPSTLKTIHSRFFNGKIDKLVIPDSVTSLSPEAFSISIIGDLSFTKNSKVLKEENGVVYDTNMTVVHFVKSSAKRIYIPPNVHYISPSQVRAHNIECVDVNASNNAYSSFLDVLYNKDQTVLQACPGNKSTVEFSPKCLTVNSSAFAECLVNKVIVNEGLKNIYFNAFNKVSISSFNIPRSLQTIASWAFSVCSITFTGSFTSNLTKINGKSFYGCTTQSLNFSQCSFINEIPTECFRGCSASSIVLPPNTITILSNCFYECLNLKSISIPSSVNAIPEAAFYKCVALSSVTFEGESNLTVIEQSSFEQSGIKSINIPDKVTAIKAAAFRSCKYLTEVKFGRSPSLTTIGFDITNGCEKLTLFEIPESVTLIEYGAFSGSTGLLNFKVSSENKIYRDINGVLFLKANATLYTYPAGRNESVITSNVTHVAKMAFRECSKLINLLFQDTEELKVINEHTFYCCSQLREIELPGSITLIKNEAFYGCKQLSNVFFRDNSQLSVLSSGVFNDCEKLKSIEFRGTSILAEIGDSALKNCRELHTFDFPSSLTQIGSSAFENCESLESVCFGNITKIGNRAFFGCSKIKKIKLPKGLQSIGAHSFGQCESLQLVTICDPKSLNFDSTVFSESGLKGIYVPAVYEAKIINGIPTIRVLDEHCNIPTDAFSFNANVKNSAITSGSSIMACMTLSDE